MLELSIGNRADRLKKKDRQMKNQYNVTLRLLVHATDAFHAVDLMQQMTDANPNVLASTVVESAPTDEGK